MDEPFIHMEQEPNRFNRRKIAFLGFSICSAVVWFSFTIVTLNHLHKLIHGMHTEFNQQELILDDMQSVVVYNNETLKEIHEVMIENNSTLKELQMVMSSVHETNDMVRKLYNVIIAICRTQPKYSVFCS